MASLIGYALSFPTIYSDPPGSGGGFTGYGGHIASGSDNMHKYMTKSASSPYEVSKPPEVCGPGEVLRSDGMCVKAIITRNVYVYSSPEIIPTIPEPPPIPRPRINYNVVFVRTPDKPESLEPIVIPPPQQKTLVFVLTKNDEMEQKIIEVPAGDDEEPEVFYINYNDGDDMKLPGDITLKEALASQQVKQGQTIYGNSAGPGYGPYDPPRGGSSQGTSVVGVEELYRGR